MAHCSSKPFFFRFFTNFGETCPVKKLFASPAASVGRRNLLATSVSAALVALSAAHVSPVYAQTETLAVPKVKFSIEAQPAASALEAYAKQSGVQLLFPSDEVADLKLKGIHGVYTKPDALEKLVEGAGLVVEWVNDGTAVVKKGGVSGKPAVGGGSAETGNAAQPVANESAQMNTVVITGTTIRGVAPVGAHVNVVTAKDLERTGRGTIQEAMQTLPQNTLGGANEGAVQVGQNALSGAAVSFGTGVNLRGLGPDSTLTLLNGRRLAPAGFGDFVDISSIPVSAVSRVEVLMDGASATYGSDAQAGVVNVILNKNFKGAETTLRSGFADGFSERRASQLFGKSWSSGHVTLGYEYYDRGELRFDERPYTASSNLTAFGGRDGRVTTCAPGNITSPAVYAGAIPGGQNGIGLTPGQIIKGQTNRCDSRTDGWMLPKQQRHSGFLSATQDISDGIEVYGDLFVSQREAEFDSRVGGATISVPVTNYYRKLNGFTAPGALVIDYNFNKDLGALPEHRGSNVTAGAIGVRADLSGTWSLDSFVAVGESREHVIRQQFDRTAGGALINALASSDPKSAFNPFGDGTGNSSAVLSSLMVPYDARYTSGYASANVKLDGDLFSLDAGAVKLAAGAEFRTERYKSAIDIAYTAHAPTSSRVNGDRRVKAVFSELYVPLVTEANSRPGVRRLELSMSARYDNYSDFGSTTNPKVGVNYEPVEGVKFSGSYGTSFKAPRLSDVYLQQGVQYLTVPVSQGGPDTNGDGMTKLLIANGGNSALKPEHGKTWTAGANFAPSWNRGLTAGITYFGMDFVDRISSLSSPFAPFTNPAPYLGSLYIPNPTQAQLDYFISRATSVTNSLLPGDTKPYEAIIVLQPANVSRVKLSGLDMQLSQVFNSQVGRFVASADFTHYLSYSNQFTAASPKTTVMNVLGGPIGWKGRFGLAWSNGGWSASVFGNYQGDYINNTVTPQRKISSQTTYDLQAGYSFGDGAGSWLRGARATISVVNLFDRAPPFADAGGVGFDARNYSPNGRMVSVNLNKRW